MQNVRIVLVGLGNLGRRFCEVVADKDLELRERYGLALTLVGAADSRGAAYDAAGLDLATVARLKREGGSVGDYPRAGHQGWGALELVSASEADLLLEASPVNLDQGAEPALSCIRTAMAKGMHVVTPNKGPLVVAFDELHALAKTQGVAFRYDGTVAGGAPALNVGCRDLRGARVLKIDAVPNLVTGYVMDLLSDGVPWDDTIEQAKASGALEGDGSWDLEGWDAAAKLTILANAVMRADVAFEDVERAGVVEVPVTELQAAVERGERYRLLATAEVLPDGSVAPKVVPTALTRDHPLGGLGRRQMGVVYTTDIYGTITLVIDEQTPVPSSATMLRDLLDIYVDDSSTLVM
jgi:homoserine dehydrogenase